MILYLQLCPLKTTTAKTSWELYHFYYRLYSPCKFPPDEIPLGHFTPRELHYGKEVTIAEMCYFLKWKHF